MDTTRTEPHATGSPPTNAVSDHGHPSSTSKRHNINDGFQSTGKFPHSFQNVLSSSFDMPKISKPVIPGLADNKKNGNTVIRFITTGATQSQHGDRQIYDPSATHNPMQNDTASTNKIFDTQDMNSRHTTSASSSRTPANSGPMPPPQGEPKTSSRRVKNYKLSDGTIVSGKGLGRGRPGVKRGPRNANNEEVDLDTPVPSSTPSHANTPSQSALSVPDLTSANQKRKRSDSDSSALNIRTRLSTSSSLTSESRQSSIEYNPRDTETRSGRKPQKPAAIVPQTSTISSPATKKPRLDSTPSATTASPSTIKTHPKIKRRIYRGREQFALCEHCLRGHGPTGNVIVFCDACNKCWHQRCHEPQVPKEVVADVKAEWFCTDCDKILHGGKKGKKNSIVKSNISSTPTVSAPIRVQPSRPIYAGPLIGGGGLSKEAKIAYLNTLSRDGLVNLIISASNLAPALPMFQNLLPPPTPVPQAQFTSNYVTPVSRPPTFGAAKDDADPDDSYEDYFDEHAALYPKPGNGVKLPPESVDMHMLLEGRSSRTFSHWVRGMPGQEFGGSANLVIVRA